MPKTKKDRLYMIGSIVLAVVILVVAAFGLLAKPKSAPAETSPVPETVIREVEKTVEVEKEITTEILHDGLRDMGILVTGEYYFTEVVSFTKNGTFLGFPVRSGYIISYDGTVTAGIDFSGISVVVMLFFFWIIKLLAGLQLTFPTRAHEPGCAAQ